MICKEEIFLWFNQLSAAGRIGVMHSLLNMCLPFELRFLGTCVEDLCQKNFDFLREYEYKANSAPDLGKLMDLSNGANRDRYIVALALLRTSNRNCSAIIYNALAAYAQHCLSPLALETTAINEIFLLFTMALCHPAFTFEQKSTLQMWLLAINNFYRTSKTDFREQECCELQCQSCLQPVAPSDDVVAPCEVPTTVVVCEVPPPPLPVGGPGPMVPPPFGCVVPASPVLAAAPGTFLPTASTPTASAPVTASVVIPPPAADVDPPGNSAGTAKCNALPAAYSKVQIKHLELKNSPRKKKGDKRLGYRIQVTWSNSEITEVTRSHLEMVDFHQKLLNYLQETRVPYFTGPKQLPSLKGEISEDCVSRMNEYLRQLMVKVPPHIINSEFIVNFFTSAEVETTSTAGGPPSRLQGHSPSSVASTTSHSPSPPPVGPTSDAGSSSTAAHLPSQFCGSAAAVDKLSQHIRALNVNNTYQPDHRRQPSAGDAPTGPGDAAPRARVHHQSPEPAQTSPLSCRPSGSAASPKLPEVALSPEWDRLLLKYPSKELANLTEDALLREGFSPKQVKQAVMLLERLKTRPPNGFTNSHLTRDEAHGVGGTARPSNAVNNARPSGHSVQTVQTRVYMPNAPMDLLMYCAATSPAGNPMTSSTSGGVGSRGASTSSSSDVLCNGDGGHQSTSCERHNDSPLSPIDARKGYSNCEPADRAGESKDIRLRRSSRTSSASSNGGASSPKAFKPKNGSVVASSATVTNSMATASTATAVTTTGKTAVATTAASNVARKRSVQSVRSTQPANGGDDESDPPSLGADDSSGSPGPVPSAPYEGHYFLPSAPPPPPHNGLLQHPPTLSSPEERVGHHQHHQQHHHHHHQMQQQQPLLVKPPPPTNNYPAPPTSHSPQQQQQQQMNNMGGISVHMTRLPSRGGGVMNQPAGVQYPGSSGTPPPPMPHPAMTYSFVPMPHHLYSTFIQAHHSNGFVGSPAGVPPPPPNYIMHSPEDSLAFQTMYQTQPPPPPQQQSGGPPPPQGSPSPQQRLPPPSAMPGFVAGPTPNVGFRGPSPGGNGGIHHGGGGPNPPPGMVMHGPGSFQPGSMVVVNGRRPKLVCYNCGVSGHHGSDCNEPTMEDINKPGYFSLSFAPSPKNSYDG